MFEKSISLSVEDTLPVYPQCRLPPIHFWSGKTICPRERQIDLPASLMQVDFSLFWGAELEVVCLKYCVAVNTAQTHVS